MKVFSKANIKYFYLFTLFSLSVHGMEKDLKALDASYAGFIYKTLNLEVQDTDGGDKPGQLILKPFEIIDALKSKGFELNKEKDSIQFPEGDYAIPYKIPYWLQVGDEEQKTEYWKRGQGWKIHVSATPESAEKIAGIVLKILKNTLFSGQEKGEKINFKIIGSLPLMRTLCDIYLHIKDQETQPGKFIVIYPHNLFHARKIALKMDKALSTCKKRGELTDDDFLPLQGDIRFGDSGGVYARYGKFHGPSNLKGLDPLGKSMRREDLQKSQNLKDNRFFPWPDFMNKKEEIWAKTESPFGDLKIFWKDNKGHVITSWEDRPNSWSDWAAVHNQKLSKEDEENDKMIAQLLQDMQIAQQLQEEEDERLAKQLEQEERKEADKKLNQEKLDRQYAQKLQEDDKAD